MDKNCITQIFRNNPSLNQVYFLDLVITKLMFQDPKIKNGTKKRFMIIHKSLLQNYFRFMINHKSFISKEKVLDKPKIKK